MTRLSVNLNRVALLRNQRDCGYPSVTGAAESVLKAGARGITVHPRPDERHIRKSDIPMLSTFLGGWFEKGVEFNIEGYPDEDFLDLVCGNRCDQVTLVPDAPDQKTSDHGWDIPGNRAFLEKVCTRLKSTGRRVSLFIDPDPEAAKLAASVGADRVELFTGPYAFSDAPIEAYVRTAAAASGAGLGVNAGHDLNLSNLARFIAEIPECAEVSIGHAITADALEYGWNGAVAAYLAALEYGHKAAKAP